MAAAARRSGHDIASPVVRSPNSQGIIELAPSAGLSAPPLRPGVTRLELAPERDGLVYLPDNAAADRPLALLVMLHGAGGDAGQSLSLIGPAVEGRELVVLAPDSRGTSWDVTRGSFGPDIAYITQALDWLLARQMIAADHLAIGGFSDGASYALSLGLINGALFSHVLSFSPGFMAPGRETGRPNFFISHGTLDTVLPIDRCARPIVAQLRQAGHALTYREFADGHVLPTSIAREAIDWFLEDR